MQVTYRIPSRKVPYGFIEFQWERASGTGMPDPNEMAEEYAQYIKDYQAAEVQAFENPTARQIQKADAKAKAIAEDKSVEEATKMLDEGLGVTEIDEDAPLAAPWDKTSDTEATSTEESKPWNVSDGDWDFS